MGWHKYGAKKTTIDGISFPSKGEAETYSVLLLLQKGEVISGLNLQETVYLTKAKISYKTDFSFTALKAVEKVWVEFKGVETDRWRLIKKLWKHYGPGRLQVYKANNRGVYLHEEIIPSGE